MSAWRTSMQTLKVLGPVRGNFEPTLRYFPNLDQKIWTKSGFFLPFVKKIRIIGVIKVFTIGFNGENRFFSHCKKFNVEISVKLKRIIFTI